MIIIFLNFMAFEVPNILIRKYWFIKITCILLIIYILLCASQVTVVGTRVLQGIKAVDADQQGPFSTVQYSVLPGPNSVRIHILIYFMGFEHEIQTSVYMYIVIFEWEHSRVYMFRETDTMLIIHDISYFEEFVSWTICLGK